MENILVLNDIGTVPPGTVSLIAGIFGLAIGSFLNVVIHRVPLGESIVLPPSHCPGCGHHIRSFDNIPLLSYLFLRGRCRYCEGPIGLRYPGIEFLTGVLFFLIVRSTGLSYELIYLLPLAAALITASMIDLDHMIIPNVITYPGIVLGFAASFLPGGIDPYQSDIGIAVGGG